MPWFGPRIHLTWGPYWPPAVEDEKPIVEMAVAAKQAGIVTTEKAVERVKDIFAIENVEAFTEQLEKEAEEAAKKQQELMAEQSPAGAPQGKPPNGTPGKTPNDNGNEPGKRVNGGGR